MAYGCPPPCHHAHVHACQHVRVARAHERACTQAIPAAQLLGARVEGPTSFTVWHFRPYTSKLVSITRTHYKAMHSDT